MTRPSYGLELLYNSRDGPSLRRPARGGGVALNQTKTKPTTPLTGGHVSVKLPCGSCLIVFCVSFFLFVFQTTPNHPATTPRKDSGFVCSRPPPRLGPGSNASESEPNNRIPKAPDKRIRTAERRSQAHLLDPSLRTGTTQTRRGNASTR